MLKLQLSPVPGGVRRRGVEARRSLLMSRLLTLSVALVMGEVSAHSFQVGFLAPFSGPQASVAEQALDGFMLATTERDSHPDNHADGHLGGLDVYVRRVDTAQPIDVTRRLVRQLSSQQKVEIFAGAATAEIENVLRRELSDSGSVLLAVEESRFLGDNGVDPAFATAFRALFGYSPSRAAFVGYCIAHTIDRAVRELAGDFAAPDRVVALLGEVRC